MKVHAKSMIKTENDSIFATDFEFNVIFYPNIAYYYRILWYYCVIFYYFLIQIIIKNTNAQCIHRITTRSFYTISWYTVNLWQKCFENIQKLLILHEKLLIYDQIEPKSKLIIFDIDWMKKRWYCIKTQNASMIGECKMV